MTQQKGRIRASLELSKAPFSKTLKEAVKESVDAAAKIRAAFNQPLTLPPVPPLKLPPPVTIPPLPGLPGRGGNPDAKRQQEEIRGIANATNALKVAYERGEVTQEQFVLGMRVAVTTADRLRKSYAENSAEFSRLTNVIGIGTRSITTAEKQLSRLGISQQVAIGSTRGLTNQLGDLQGTLLPLVGVAGLGGLVTLTSRLATESNRVIVAQDILALTLDRTGQSGESAQQAITGVANELGLAEGQIIDYITQLVRVGFTTEQAQQALIAGGASALAFGKTAAVGVESVTGALVTQNSVLLNTIGISENIGKAMTDAATANRQYGEDAANAAAAQAGLEIILKATGAEVDSLDRLMSGLAGSQSEAAATAFNVRQEFGEMLIPLEILRNEALTGVLKGFEVLPGPAQAGAASFGAMTVGVGALATGLSVLKPLLAATFVPPAGAVVIGIAVLAGMTSGLIALARAAQTSVTPFKSVSQNAQVTREAIGKASDKETLAGALEALSTQLDGKGKEAVKNYAAEIREAKGDVDDFRASADKLVTDVSLDQALADRARILGELKKTPTVEDPAAVVRDLQDRLNRSPEFQNLGFQLKLGVEKQNGQFVIQFLDDIQKRATLSADAAILLSESLASTKAQINNAPLREELIQVNAVIKELRKASETPLPVPKPTSTYNPQVVADLEAQLQEVQDLRGKIASSASDLERAQADTVDDPLKALRLQFGLTEREIITSTNNLIADVQSQVDRGLISQAEAQTQVDELQRQGFARLELNEKNYTEGTKTELNRRKQIVLEAERSIAEIRAGDTAAAQRSSGNEVGALETELDLELQTIRDGLAQQLQAEDLTKVQRQAFRDEARAREVAATNGFNRSVASLNAEARQEQAAADEQAVQESLERQGRVQEQLAQSRSDLSQSRVANVEGAVPKLMAEFALERSERRKAFQEQLADFEGTASERAELVKNFNARERQAGFAHQRQIGKEQQTAYGSYLEALQTHQAEIATAQAEARQAEIEGQKALLAARETGAQSRLDTVNDDPTASTQKRVDAFRRLIDVQQQGVLVARAFTQAERDRGASASEIVAALNAEADAQAKVVTSTQAQIDKLKSLRDEQIETLKSGNDFLDYAREASSLSGREFGALDEKDAAAGLRAQQAALADVLRSQIAANAPLQERLETLRQIQVAESELQSKGERSGLDGGDRQLINDDADKALSEYPQKAAAAVSEIKSLDNAIRGLGGTLEEAVGQLAALFEAAGSGKALPKVPVTVDDEGVKEARKALEETFGADAGAKILGDARTLGRDAGRGFAGALATGVRNNRETVISEIKALLEDIDSYLPHSDAKRGPLSRLSHAGRAIPRTIAEHIRKGIPEMGSAMSAMPQPSFAIPTSRPSYYPSAAGAGGAVGGDTYQITVDGGRETPSSVLEGEVRRAAASVRREAKLINRRRS